jgi:hypothetical protein
MMEKAISLIPGRRLSVIALVVLAGLIGCREAGDKTADSEPPPLGDTLSTIYEAIVTAATTDRHENFRKMLVLSETQRLDRIRENYGAMSIGWCLERQLGSWPNLDTLVFEDLVHQPPYARVSFSGAGAYAAYDDRVRYTFLLFRQNDTGWRLAGVSSLEKDRFDRYGTELGYLETELPSQLRFPRLF